MTVSSKSQQEEGSSGEVERKIEWKLSEVNTRGVSIGQNELIWEFKIVAGDVISPIGITKEFLRFGVDCE